MKNIQNLLMFSVRALFFFTFFLMNSLNAVSMVDYQLQQVKDAIGGAIEDHDVDGYINALYDLQAIDEDEDIKVDVVNNCIAVYGTPPVPFNFDNGIDEALSGANTALHFANTGTGSGAFKLFFNNVGYFKSLIAGSNITFDEDAATVTISGPDIIAGSGANIGTGTGTIYASNTGDQLNFNSIKAGTNLSLTIGSINVSNPLSNSTITINSNAVTGATNVGSGAQSILKTGQTNLQIKTLAAGSNVTLTNPASNTIQINGPAAGTAASAGTGQALYVSKVGNVINFNTLTGGSNIAVSAPASNEITITTNAVTGATNLGTGTPLLVTGQSNLQFKTLAAGTYATITSGANALTIDVQSTNQTITLSSFAATNASAVGGTMNLFKTGNMVIMDVAGLSFTLSTAGANFITISGVVPAGYRPIQTTSCLARIRRASNSVYSLGKFTVTPAGDFTCAISVNVFISYSVGEVFNAGSSRVGYWQTA